MLVYSQVGDRMIYLIEENEKSEIRSIPDGLNIIISDIKEIYSPESIVKNIIKKSKYLEMLHVNEDVMNVIEDTIINDENDNHLIEDLSKRNYILFSLIIGYTKLLKEHYKEMKNTFKDATMIIKCDKNNIEKCLKTIENLNQEEIELEAFSISLSEYKEILSKYDLDKLDNKNIKIYYQKNNSAITIKELYKLSLDIDKIVKEIKKYNLSPLEQVMYVYDEVKKREYKDCEDKLLSRDLDKVINGTNIVCVGYSNMFNAVLKSLNINATALISDKKHHQRSLIYLKDDKYKIDGLYVFDPTWDSKKNDQYIDNYKYFGLTLEEAERTAPTELYQNTNLSFEQIKKIYMFDIDTYNREDIEKLNDIELLFNFAGVSKEYKEFHEIMKMYKFSSAEDRLKAKNIYNNFLVKYNAPKLSEKTLFEALLTTRIIEYYKDITKEINVEDIKEAIIFSRSHRKANNETCDAYTRLLLALFGDDSVEDSLEQFEKQNNESIKRRVLIIRLLKTLRNSQK